MIDDQIDKLEKILTACDRHTLAGQRDYAILRLLSENSLKRQQVSDINISDFDFEKRSLQIQNHYRRQSPQKQLSNQPKNISLSLDTANALQDWLSSIYIPTEIPTEIPNQLSETPETLEIPLFISLERSSYGHRLTGTAIYNIVKRAALNAGITEAIAPEKLRFTQENLALKQDIETRNKTYFETNKTQTRKGDLSKLEYETQYRTQGNTSESQIRTTPYAHTEFSPNILTALLTDKRSLNTRRAYEKDLHYFFLAAYGQKPTEAVIAEFLQLGRFEAIAIALQYKSDLIAKGLKEGRSVSGYERANF
jgi:hypothetical protein